MVRKGRSDIHGILLIDKPGGLSSSQVVGRIKRRFNLRKVGHAGTLDPIATGLLPICINEGTKLAGLLAERGKEYRFTLKLGVETDSYDRTGSILKTLPVDIDETQIHGLLSSFRGALEQIPPMFSAKKINGQPLYKKARRGEYVERKAVSVEVHALEIQKIDLPELDLTVRAGKGFYVRSLCHDIGEALGCGGHLQTLIRTAHGVFDLEDAVGLDALIDEGEEGLETRLIPLESRKIDIPLLTVSRTIADSLKQGHPISVDLALEAGFSPPDDSPDLWRAIGPDGRIVALLELKIPFSEWPGLQSTSPVWTVRRGISI